MKKTIYNKFDKKIISTLPRVLFEGRIITILTAGETEKAVEYLLSAPILGIDTETRPSFRRGVTHKVSLLQVSTTDTCFLFRLNYTDLTPALIRLLEDEKVPKVGLSLNDDIRSLQARKTFKPGFFIDLQKHVSEIGIEDMSLQKLYANLIGQRISKTQQLSNWEADILQEKQKRYAATDAWACIMLYKELSRLKKNGEFMLINASERDFQKNG
ncbi:3'-5' exonuclease [Prevotella sp. OH937_COT-195]|uniref:3'-5' exonuclease n=1 Tax=Prevotella sp. OH937_COT-195 TaxID=2491051 RepID=UPI000F65132C|nr:3'-5' exonuclease [Prevotella sp. OH937_COT-195]RRC97133.1 3'-5' exonuclease domain-containing protein 2 [Prevotella sp. OH937_COT-195]